MVERNPDPPLPEWGRAAILEREIVREIGRAAALSSGGESWDAQNKQSMGTHSAKVVYRKDSEGVAVVVKKRSSGITYTALWTVFSLGLLFWVYPLYRWLTRDRNRDKYIRIQVSPTGEVTKERVETLKV